jgi:hypothetical protein
MSITSEATEDHEEKADDMEGTEPSSKRRKLSQPTERSFLDLIEAINNLTLTTNNTFDQTWLENAKAQITPGRYLFETRHPESASASNPSDPVQGQTESHAQALPNDDGHGTMVESEGLDTNKKGPSDESVKEKGADIDMTDAFGDVNRAAVNLYQTGHTTLGAASPKSNELSPSSRPASKAKPPPADGPQIIPKGNSRYNINGIDVNLPPGFTLEGYLAMRPELAHSSPAASSTPSSIVSVFKDLDHITPTAYNQPRDIAPDSALDNIKEIARRDKAGGEQGAVVEAAVITGPVDSSQ